MLKIYSKKNLGFTSYIDMMKAVREIESFYDAEIKIFRFHCDEYDDRIVPHVYIKGNEVEINWFVWEVRRMRSIGIDNQKPNCVQLKFF